VRLVLLGRPGCHLCDEAREVISDVSGEFAIDLVEVDIEADDALLRRYLERIPVIQHRDEEWFELEVDRSRLVDLLKAAASIGPSDDQH